MLRIAFAVTCMLMATGGNAATTYRVEFQREGWPRASSSREQVTVDGANVRVDYEPAPDRVGLHHSALSRDGGQTFIAVNDELRTWYRLDRSPFVLYPRSVSGRSDNGVARKIEWSTVRNRPGEADAPTHEGKLSYTFDEDLLGSRVTIRCTASVRVWSNSKLDAGLWPGRAVFSTGVPEVDRQLADGSAAFLQAFPERIVLVATQQYEGGAPITETISMTVVEVRSLERAAPGFFERPRGYIEQAPVYGIPGP